MVSSDINNFWIRLFDRFKATPLVWLVPGLSLFLDTFIFILPSDLFFSLSILADPKGWKRTVFATVVAALLAHLIIFVIMQDHELSHYLNGLVAQLGYGAETAAETFNKYGAWSILLISFSPFPVQIPVMLSSLTGVPLWEVLPAVAVGRAIRCSILVLAVRGGKRIYDKRHPHHTSDSNSA